jgi:hypothetical protein
LARDAKNARDLEVFSEVHPDEFSFRLMRRVFAVRKER